MSTERWPVRHPGIGILYYDSEKEARVAAGTAGELLPPLDGVTWASGPKEAFREVHQSSTKGLHPTKTRLALLDAIAAGEVTGYPYYESDHVDYFWGIRVTSRVLELLRAGWVWAPRNAYALVRRPDFKPELTDLGRKVREEGRRG